MFQNLNNIKIYVEHDHISMTHENYEDLNTKLLLHFELYIIKEKSIISPKFNIGFKIKNKTFINIPDVLKTLDQYLTMAYYLSDIVSHRKYVDVFRILI